MQNNKLYAEVPNDTNALLRYMTFYEKPELYSWICTIQKTDTCLDDFEKYRDLMIVSCIAFEISAFEEDSLKLSVGDCREARVSDCSFFNLSSLSLKAIISENIRDIKKLQAMENIT
ncbi:hypothetical protein CRE_29797 [Caenorhabditis remanei]|uniref:Uncharacterized protein n=1 Tax=Caenorhabditis remanei TaxID=31234 RepID=E3LVU9_CAERE|nr:hypothetical protein CRE_29797 [Caenorhabditis remanei]